MTTFADALMMRLHAVGGVPDVLFPAGALREARIRQLVTTLYGLPAAGVHSVAAVEVTATEFQRPLFPPHLLAGTWTRTTPDHARTDVQYEGREAGAGPEWVDLSVRLTADLVLELDGSEVESITLGDIGEFATLAEFEAKFRYFDLAGYMARHHLSTVEELKGAYRHLLGQVTLKTPPPFNPADPANQRRMSLDLAVLIRDTVDLTAALRSARLVRDVTERGLAYRRDADGFDVRAPIAAVLVVPVGAIAASGLPEPDLLAFLAGQDVLAVPVPP